MNKVTCDTIVEITETPAYLMSLTLEGCAITWRTRTAIGSSDDQMCLIGGCPVSWVEDATWAPVEPLGEGGTPQE